MSSVDEFAELGEWDDHISKIAEQGIKVQGAREEGMDGESIDIAMSHCAEWVKQKATWKGRKRDVFGSSSSSRRRILQNEQYSVKGIVGIVQSALTTTAMQLGLSANLKTRASRRTSPLHKSWSEGHTQAVSTLKEVEGEVEGKTHGDAPGREVGALPRPEELIKKTGSCPELEMRKEMRRRRAFAEKGSSSWSEGKICEGSFKGERRTGPPDMEWMCLPYYLMQGSFALAFVTEKAGNMSNLTNDEKLAMLLMLALSVCNFVTTTTTSRSTLLFIILRCLCDALNLIHSVVLLLISIWLPRTTGNRETLLRWLTDFPFLSHMTNLPSSHVCAYLGSVAFLLALTRIGQDLRIDIIPKLREVPLILTGLTLLLLIPVNVVYRTEKEGTLAGNAANANVAASYAAGGSGHAVYSLACRAGGWGVCLFVLEEGRWCASHVLTSALVLAVINLAGPPHRSIGLPIIAIIATSGWGIAVAVAGIVMGPEALPFPGLPFFILLSAACILFSKHLSLSTSP